MPHIPFADERVFVDKFNRYINGRTCAVYVYREKHSTWFGLREWEARHVRVEVPYRDQKKVEYVHETRGRSMFESMPDSQQEQVQDAIQQAEDWIEHRDAVKRGEPMV